MWYNVSPNTVLLTFTVVSVNKYVCADLTFNDSIREHSVKQEIASQNKTSPKVNTLQRELHGRQASFVPSRYPFYHGYQEVPDNALSSSSYSRGIAHHDSHADYFHDYEETPHISHAPFAPEAHHYDPGHGYLLQHEPHHELSHHEHHHPIGYGHYKHYDHGLKAILLPVAGLAILGAAAALVSNPVLLQLGVVSGRRRRDTEEVTSGPEGKLDASQLWRDRYEPLTSGVTLVNGGSHFQRKALLRNAPVVVNKLFRYSEARPPRPVLPRPERLAEKTLIPVPLMEA